MVLHLADLDRTQIALVGGKAAALGELTRVVRVPAGFVVTPGPVEIAGRIDEGKGYAVRSSATAEDLPTASFAGQHESYLNVVGSHAILEHIELCRASLFTERAVTYRERQGIESAQMAVIVQEMVPARAAGVMFTADPVSGNRHVAVVEAVPGLADDLVSGRVTPDTYRVRDGVVVGSGPLTEAQVLELVGLGRRIQAHFGSPQDIEWCLAEDGFWFVQSRPITTLFPIPENDGGKHVWVSVGHQQMMTDAMKPLGISFWRMMALAPMHDAGGRLFIDITARLATPSGRASLLATLGRSEPLSRDALETIIERGFIPSEPDGPPPPARGEKELPEVAVLIERTQTSLAALKETIRGKSGADLLDFIREDIRELQRLMSDPESFQALMAFMEASFWLNENLEAWLGERNAIDTLTLSVPNNVTSEMGLALLDVADTLREHPEAGIPAAFLEKYGMRCAAEIDITRPRWSEDPSPLLPLLQAHIRDFAPGEAQRRFADGLRRAQEKEQEILERLRALPDGEQKADEVKRRIDRVRRYAGYREFPKYGIISRFWIYKQALLAEAERLSLREKGDIDFLRFEELQSGHYDEKLVQARKEAYRWHQTLTPPRMLTSEGECISGAYRREDLPPGALAGLPVSAGVVEGRARVILTMAEAHLEPGDILVTRFTDPSWTPLFLGLSGLVAEVGGMMTHGSVIAREYGLPAVVAVERATRLIRDGQRIRVDGTNGFVELL